MAPSLAVLDRSNVPVLTVASPPNSCNARHRGVAVVVDGLTSRPFIGVQLATGSHADLLGASVGAVERRVCGTPEPKNIEAAQRLAIGWLGEMLGREGRPKLQQRVLRIATQQRAVVVDRRKRGGEEDGGFAPRQRLPEQEGWIKAE